MIETAKEHIEGKINLEEVKERINNYYKVLDNRKSEEESNEEADKVSVRITEILSDKSFNFNPTELISIRKRLSTGVYKQAGIIRNYKLFPNQNNRKTIFLTRTFWSFFLKNLEIR